MTELSRYRENTKVVSDSARVNLFPNGDVSTATEADGQTIDR